VGSAYVACRYHFAIVSRSPVVHWGLWGRGLGMGVVWVVLATPAAGAWATLASPGWAGAGRYHRWCEPCWWEGQKQTQTSP